MLPTIKITRVERVPEEEGEEPGFPGYKVTGSSTLNGRISQFTIKTYCEIDGRDTDHEILKGKKDLLEDMDFLEAYQEALVLSEIFLVLHKTACDEYYKSYQP